MTKQNISDKTRTQTARNQRKKQNVSEKTIIQKARNLNSCVGRMVATQDKTEYISHKTRIQRDRYMNSCVGRVVAIKRKGYIFIKAENTNSLTFKLMWWVHGRNQMTKLNVSDKSRAHTAKISCGRRVL